MYARSIAVKHITRRGQRRSLAKIKEVHRSFSRAMQSMAAATYTAHAGLGHAEGECDCDRRVGNAAALAQRRDSRARRVLIGRGHHDLSGAHRLRDPQRSHWSTR
jgi:hypothetical protein